MGVTQFLRISVTVADLSRQIGFYRDALGLACGPERVPDDPAWPGLLGLPAGTTMRVADVSVGHQTLELASFDPPGKPYPAARASNDQWFQHIALACGDIEQVWTRLQGHCPEAVTAGGPVHLPRNTGGVTAFKFRDPEGHPLELIHFPTGAGASVWHTKLGAGILGYDHSALVVTDVARSLAFYDEVLGLHVGGRSLNRGPEQDRLDGLDACEVDVVALEPAGVAVPHVELLHYRAPPGRLLTTETPAADTASIRQIHEVDHLDALVVRLRDAGVRFVSEGIVAFKDGARAVAIRDPDGHMLVLTEPGA